MFCGVMIMIMTCFVLCFLLLVSLRRLQHPTIRLKLVQALILLRNRGVVDPTELVGLFFGLFQCQASTASGTIYTIRIGISIFAVRATIEIWIQLEYLGR